MTNFHVDRGGTVPGAYWHNINLTRKRLNTPALKEAADRFEVVAKLYEAAWDASYRSLFTSLPKDEQVRLAKLAFEAGFYDDSNKAKAAVGGAMPSLLKQITLETKSKDLFNQAAELHAKLWKGVLPLARDFAGEETTESPIDFEIMSTIARPPMNYLKYRNGSGKKLHNVTILIETGVSKSRLGEGRFFYFFDPEIDADAEGHAGIPLPDSLIDGLTRGTQLPAGRKCLKYSIWADELRREDVTLSVSRQKPKPVGQPAARAMVFIYSLIPSR